MRKYISKFFGKELPKIIFTKEAEVIKGQKKLHDEGLRDLYSSLNIIRMTK
jgi:hypothetical protein